MTQSSSHQKDLKLEWLLALIGGGLIDEIISNDTTRILLRYFIHSFVSVTSFKYSRYLDIYVPLGGVTNKFFKLLLFFLLVCQRLVRSKHL